MPEPGPRTGGPDPDVAAWLTGPEGREAVTATVDALARAGGDSLAVGQRLRDDGLVGVRAAAVVDAAVARREAAGRHHGGAGDLLLSSAALEQASDPAVAAHRARRFTGGPCADLCAGAGIDSRALAAAGGPVVAVEVDPGRVRLLSHNTAGHDASAVRGDALRPPVAGLAVHADPDRRGPAGRAGWLADYTPPVPALLEAVRTAGAPGAGITVSPAVSWHDRGLPGDAEVEFIQVGGRLVEAVLWLGDLRGERRRATATLLADDPDATSPRARQHRGQPVPELPVGPVGALLLEPAPAAVRARLHDRLGRHVGARRVARRRAILTTDEAPASPWWTSWQVEAVLPCRPRDVRPWLRDQPERPLSISLHGVDADPGEWLEQLGNPPTGPNGRRLHLIRTDDGARAVAAHRR